MPEAPSTERYSTCSRTKRHTSVLCCTHHIHIWICHTSHCWWWKSDYLRGVPFCKANSERGTAASLWLIWRGWWIAENLRWPQWDWQHHIFLCERLIQQWVQFKEKMRNRKGMVGDGLQPQHNFLHIGKCKKNRCEAGSPISVQRFTCPLTLFGRCGNVSLNEQIAFVLTLCCSQMVLTRSLTFYGQINLNISPVQKPLPPNRSCVQVS